MGASSPSWSSSKRALCLDCEAGPWPIVVVVFSPTWHYESDSRRQRPRGRGPQGARERDRGVARGRAQRVRRLPHRRLNRAGAHGDDVVDLHGLFDDERLAVLDADQVAVEAGDGAEALANLLLVGKQGAALDGFPVLRGIAQQGRHAALELGADIDDEGRLDLGIDAGIEDLERAVGLGVFVEFAESGEEAGLETDLDRKSTRLNSSHLGISY